MANRRELRPMTHFAYVVGHPIGHSISPEIHNAGFAARGIDARYQAVDVSPADLASWVSSVCRVETLGFNVTVPHKERIGEYMDAIEGDAKLAGAVNTVTLRPASGPPPAAGPGRALVGVNTDTIGFRRSLAEEAGVALRGQRVVLIGAGGAARAIAVVALQDGAADLTVANRHRERAERLLNDLESITRETTVRALQLGDSALSTALRQATVVVNATSVGMQSAELPLDPGPIAPGGLVVDIVYNPPDTSFLRAGRIGGARVLGGLGMLVYQAAAAFELWTGVRAPVEVMRTAAAAALFGKSTDRGG